MRTRVTKIVKTPPQTQLPCQWDVQQKEGEVGAIPGGEHKQQKDRTTERALRMRDTRQRRRDRPRQRRRAGRGRWKTGKSWHTAGRSHTQVTGTSAKAGPEHWVVERISVKPRWRTEQRRKAACFPEKRGARRSRPNEAEQWRGGVPSRSPARAAGGGIRGDL